MLPLITNHFNHMLNLIPLRETGWNITVSYKDALSLAFNRQRETWSLLYDGMNYTLWENNKQCRNFIMVSHNNWIMEERNRTE